MYIFNITFHPETGIMEQWLEFVRKQWLPAIMDKNIPRNPRLLRILYGDQPAFALQLEFPDRESLDQFLDLHWPQLAADMQRQFHTRAPFFSVGMEKMKL